MRRTITRRALALALAGLLVLAGRTALVVTHDPSDIDALGAEIFRLGE